MRGNGWGADHARLRWWLYPETNGPIAPAPVPLRVVSEAHQATDGSVTLRLESSKPRTPDKYDFFYQGSGWFGMAVFER